MTINLMQVQTVARAAVELGYALAAQVRRQVPGHRGDLWFMAPGGRGHAQQTGALPGLCHRGW